MSNGVFEYLNPNVIVDNAGTDITYDVIGDGVVLVSASYYSDTTDSSGYWSAALYHNDVLIYGDWDQFGTSTANNYGSSICCPVEVSNGDTLRVYLQNSKSGTKYVKKRFLCFGCSVSRQS